MAFSVASLVAGIALGLLLSSMLSNVWHDTDAISQIGDGRRLAAPTAACPAFQSIDFAMCLAKAIRPTENLLGGGVPGTYRGANEHFKPKVPKRASGRGQQSNSLSRQTQHIWMWKFVDEFGSRVKSGRCLDWDGAYGGSVFASICAEVDIIHYTPPPHGLQPKNVELKVGKGQPPKVSHRFYHVDVHTMSTYLDHDSYDLIIANSVFEHFHQPFHAMRECAALLRPGGLIFWHTPFEFEQHGVPSDFFRYTVHGARAIAESADLKVELVEADGGYAAVVANVLGLGAKFFENSQLAAGEDRAMGPDPIHYLNTRMVASKPHAASDIKTSDD